MIPVLDLVVIDSAGQPAADYSSSRDMGLPAVVAGTSDRRRASGRATGRERWRYAVPVRTSSQTRTATSAMATPRTATRRCVEVRRET